MVKQRNPFMVIVLSLCTFGIYALFWYVWTKNEMNELGAEIPTAWLIIVPIANIYWLWKYCEGVEKVSKGETQGIMVFLMMILLGPIGMWMVQSALNKLAK